MNVMPLEMLKAQEASLGALITCTEGDVSLITSKALMELTRQLSERIQSRESVTRAIVLLWTSVHMTFFCEHHMGARQMAQVYQLTGLWLRQRLFLAQLSDNVPDVHFAQFVTVGRQAETRMSGLSDNLFQIMQFTLVQEQLGWDVALLAVAEVLADTITELYRIRDLPYGLDLWPLTAYFIEWEELTSQSGPMEFKM